VNTLLRALSIVCLSAACLHAQNPVAIMATPQNQRGVKGTLRKNVESANKSVNVLGSESYSYQVPLFHLPGRGMDLDLTLIYNSHIYPDVGANVGGIYGLNTDLDVPSPGFRLDYGFLEVSEPPLPHPWCPGSPLGTPDKMALIDGDASKHNLVPVGGCASTLWVTDDSTYIQVRHDITNHSETITYPNGRTVTYLNYVSTGLPNVFWFRPTTITDPNGNTITITYSVPAATAVDTSISTVTDTVGRTITFFYDIGGGTLSKTGVGYLSCVTDGATCTSVGAKTFNFTWNHNYTLTCNFNVIVAAFPTCKNQTVSLSGLSVMTGVHRPDLTSVQFNYSDWEIVNDIQELGATGLKRYEVSYDYPPGTVQQTTNPAYTTQTVFDGVNTEKWTYKTTKSSATGFVTSYAVTDPMGATKTSTFSNNGDWQDGLLIQQTVPTATLTTLKTLNATWTSDNGTSGINVRPTNIPTILDDGSQSQVTYVSYDANGNLTDMKEYDLGPGAPGPLLRETVIAFNS
jgi:hypothetical protein